MATVLTHRHHVAVNRSDFAEIVEDDTTFQTYNKEIIYYAVDR